MKVIIKYDTWNFKAVPNLKGKWFYSQEKKDFLKNMQFFHNELTKLKYNIEMYNAFLLYFNKVSEKYRSFVVFFLNNLSKVIGIDFAIFFERKNGINFAEFKNKCLTNKKLFSENKLQQMRLKCKNFQKAEKIFAHRDEINFDDEKMAKVLNNIDYQIMKECVDYLIDIVNSIWYAYCKTNLCFKLQNGDCYEKVLKLLLMSV